jgi:hypothetical protein
MADEKPTDPKPESPDPADKLTASEREAVLRWYGKNAPNDAICPVCQTKNWTVLDNFVTPLVVGNAKRNEVRLFGPSVLYPHFMLVCKQCGNTLFINALRAGILKLPTTEPSSENEEGKK